MSRNYSFKIYVGKLPLDFTKSDVEDIFNRYGSLVRCNLRYSKFRAFAFIEFEEERSAMDAIKYENNRRVRENNIIVEWAKKQASGPFSRPLMRSRINQCYNCLHYGHYAYNCPELERDIRRHSHSRSHNRCSYHQGIADLVPDNFLKFVPLKPRTTYKYGQEGAENLPGTVAAQQLTAALKDECTAEEALLLIKDLPNPLQEDDVESTHNPLKIDVFVQTLLNFADKSFCHAFAAIEKYHTVLKVLSTSEEAQICILRSMFELWHCHQQMIVELVTKFLTAKIVECSSVANWLFSKEMAAEFPKFYIWEILHLTIRKMIGHVTNIQKQVMDAKKKMQKEDAMEKDEDEDEALYNSKPTEEMIEEMEEKLDTAQSELKNLFLIIFQRFIMLLTEHIARCEAEGIDFNSYWFKYTLGRLQDVFFQHHEQVFKYLDTLKSLFTSDIDHHILSVFQQFCALKA